MNRKREVDRFSTVFDLKIGKALRLPQSISARVMFTYDKNKMEKEFTILDHNLNADISNLIKWWLMENVDTYQDIYVLYSVEMDADLFQKASNY